MSASRKKYHQRRHQVAGQSRNGWACAFCGAEVQCIACFPDTKRPASTDHIVPKSRGGSNDLSNLQIACVSCNKAKGSNKHPRNEGAKG